MTGSAEENYCRNLVEGCVNKGWRPLVNFRWRIDYYEHRDIDAIVTHVGRKYPRAPIVAVGYSAGAHVLMTYLQVRSCRVQPNERVSFCMP